jgi:transcriptional regulator with XRE-family HTH domain
VNVLTKFNPERQGCGAVNDQNELTVFQDKEYRDSYLETHVRSGIAYQIHALREKEGLNQKDFGDKIGKKQSVVCRLEDTEYGSVSVNTLLDIAKALDVALLVKFCSYPKFLEENKDLSPAALKVENIHGSYAASQAVGVQDTINTLHNTSVVGGFGTATTRNIPQSYPGVSSSSGVIVVSLNFGHPRDNQIRQFVSSWQNTQNVR